MSLEWEAGRLDSDLEGVGFDTLAVRAGQHRTPEGEHGEAMFLTSSYVFRSAADAAARFAGEQPGNVYSRYTNPTVRAFEERIAALEGAEQAVATASGMAAILAIVMSQCSAGDHVLVSRSVFGSTISLFEKYLKRFGIEVDYPPLADLAAWEAAFKPNTKLLFVESPSNPLAELVDIAALAEIAHAHKALLVVDNCFCTPALQQPLKLGADIIMHSATKYIDGQGRGLGGVVAGRKAEMEAVVGFLRTAGPTLSPFNAWMFLKGLETLRVRMQAHSASALALAQWLETQPGIDKVYYAGLPSHPQHELAKRQQSAFGAVVSFEVKGGKEAAWRFIDATKVISITTNLGDTKTTIAHPATTSHGRLSPQERANAGIRDNLIRVAVGLEDVADLKADLARGLAAL
ncbi:MULTISPECIES: O-succinylhomoserine sulfhydrylase [Pseudomonadaceae]|jgi:O-succinylhomoserine sulfhydrylase|uniref:O-succinylhomoserine sulfhydrylase n=2 Tax=Aquipseudomonas alcaligenes TaxID=43263 RepID=A0AA42STN1_AQUAC|nr:MULTISPECIES: O-succinylhomoserine sulfhydrylase [Pseudomonas]MDH0144550.1 O-succinylhomoserine sulfhydrylase [Pseudomonas alcaligenes]MDH1056158.1 O-succinylhomoserine sulfhydrylase [Pseudomonas alcaligenes]MEE1951557.1 O-succinylhomoserine sulfhydrylase [Pseudomonas alcaligenes]NMY42821.1 O-succinylhomoserine sulfhydrylase [Pseudomonas sp. WS 5013]SUD14799.1 O-succinylhomoserine sulfhydrylase [Pseudomonas alcaligenes]